MGGRGGFQEEKRAEFKTTGVNLGKEHNIIPIEGSTCKGKEMSKTTLTVRRVSNGAEREHAGRPSGWRTQGLHAAPRSLDFVLVASGNVPTEAVTSFRLLLHISRAMTVRKAD